LPLLDIFIEIGAIFANEGNYPLALRWTFRGMEICLRMGGLKSLSKVMEMIGTIQIKIGENTKAFEYMEKSLAMQIKILGVFHPEIAINLNSIAYVYSKIGDNKKALEYQKKSQEI
jgi:tetratricopeptide (TPR) repeat protein